MIIKTLSRKSGTGQVINYLFKDKEKLGNKQFKPLVIRHNIRARKLDKVVKEFEANEALRKAKRKDSVKVYHTVISFGKEDKGKITEPMLRDFAKKYMQLQGKDNMFIMTQHIEKDHIHLHCVMSGTKYLTGVANRLSRAEFSQLKLAMQDYQKERYPMLTNSLPEHGKAKNKGFDKDNRQTQKVALSGSLSKAYEQSSSLPEFLAFLKTEGHEPYFRGERLAGIKYEGETKFRLGRLGYDDDKLKALDDKSTDDKEMEEIESIRSQSDSSDREDDKNRNMEDDSDKEDEIESDDGDDDDTR